MAMIQKKRIAKRIHILHTVTDEELSDLYRGATALLFPSIYEGFGLPVLEAMACGTPVVTTRAASLPEVGGDAALYLSSENDSELLEYMRQFENGSIDCGFFTRKSLDQASKFSWERCVAHTIKVYRDCLGS
jgi:glycosyltransferase involved in cell wall biosynthesis